MGGLFQLFLGRGEDFQELGRCALFGLLTADLGTVRVPLGVSFSLLIEDQGLVIKVDLSAILNSFDSNQFMLYPLGYVILSKVVPCPLPSCFTATEPTCCNC